MKFLIKLAIFSLVIACGITMIYDSEGRPDYDAINEQMKNEGCDGMD